MLAVGQLPVGIFLMGGPVDALVSGITDQLAAAGKDGSQACLVEATGGADLAGAGSWSLSSLRQGVCDLS